MSEHTPRLTIVVGSNRKGRFGPTVAQWFEELARKRGDMDVDTVDIAALEIPMAMGEEPGPSAGRPLAEAAATLAGSDAFVVVTPEYNHSFPGALKSFIDLHREEWHAKPVGFVSYGGMAGGQRAVEHLRQVFAELHAVTVRHTVSFHNPWGRFDGSGAEPAAAAMLDQIAWWARTLTQGRATAPYAV